jgi:hypothetical protein
LNDLINANHSLKSWVAFIYNRMRLSSLGMEAAFPATARDIRRGAMTFIAHAVIIKSSTGKRKLFDLFGAAGCR